MSKNQIPDNFYTDNTNDLERNEILNFISTKIDEGLRIDVFLSCKTDKTRSFIQRLFDENLVSVNGKNKKKNYKIQSGDEISVVIPMPERADILPENIPLDIVYEDEYLLVVDKPKGMVVHPAPGNYSGTLVNALMHHCGDSLSGINGYIRPGIVHRIDKDTSGLLIVAKTDESHRGLAEQIAIHSFERMYEAVVVGNLKEDEFTIDLPIGRHPADRKKMAVVYENSKNAKTDVKIIKRYNGYTHVRLFLHTGRTHQIRVHMSHLGHPVLGDTVYGNKSKVFPHLEGQCLLAKYISFIHPISKETITLTAQMPHYFKEVIEKLEKIQ